MGRNFIVRVNKNLCKKYLTLTVTETECPLRLVEKHLLTGIFTDNVGTGENLK